MASFVSHYKPLERKINDAIVPYTYIGNLLITLGCVIAYFVIDGKEQVLKFYIPLDVALNLSKACFYWYTYLTDKWEKENEAAEQTTMNELAQS